MSHPPLNLAARDFDAYAAEKASSNAFTRPRIEVKQRALAWARGVVARLAELGIAVEVHGSDEHPSLRNKKRVDCQWVFFWRDQAARDELERLQGRGRSMAAEIDDPSPFRRHAFLALRLDAAAVEVCFAVHPEAQVDVENLRARLAEARDDDASPLTTALRALPEQFSLGLSPDHRPQTPGRDGGDPQTPGRDGGDPQTPGAEVPAVDRVAASAITSEALHALLERAAAGQVPLWIGWSVGRDTAIEHSALLDEQLEDALVALAPIYRLVAWSRENDRVSLDRRIESAEQDRARAHAEAQAQTERWRVEQAEARRSAAEQARARAPVHEPLPAARRRASPRWRRCSAVTPAIARARGDARGGCVRGRRRRDGRDARERPDLPAPVAGGWRSRRTIIPPDPGQRGPVCPPHPSPKPSVEHPPRRPPGPLGRRVPTRRWSAPPRPWRLPSSRRASSRRG